MHIVAKAHLEYWDNKSEIGRSEYLELIVRFREKHKLHKTKLNKELVSTLKMYYGKSEYKTYDEYIGKVYSYLDDIDLIKKEAEMAIREYMINKVKNKNQDHTVDDIYERIEDIGKIKIEVEI